MELGIVTVFKTNNCGSYLQAWALSQQMKKLNHNASFVRYSIFYDSWLDTIFQAAKAYIKGRFPIARFLIKRKLNFVCAQKTLPKCGLAGKDSYVFGSDTIWNFGDDFFKNRVDYFTGKWTKKKKISYAVSAGSSVAADFNAQAVKQISDFDAISLRDVHSKSIINELLPNIEPVMVVDPTMLLAPADYLSLEKTCLDYGFVFIYYFGHMPDELCNNIKNFAKNRNLKTVSMGFPDARFDINLVSDPGLFLGYMRSAEFVVTNTFHGNIFSILFNKVFVTDASDKKKVVCLLEEFNLLDQLIDDPKKFEGTLLAEISYNGVNSLLDVKRHQSVEYLRKNLM